MNMFIRIFYGNYCKDISLNNLQEFVVGSRTDTGFEIPNSDMEPEHIKFTKNGNDWSVEAIGKVYLNRKPVNTSQLKPHQLYILSPKYRISLLVINEYSTDNVQIPLNGIKVVSIGRETTNNIVFKSDIVSGTHAIIEIINSTVHIIDKDSTNGTYVNGNKVDDSILREGNEILIGAYKIIYKSNLLTILGEQETIISKNISHSDDNSVSDKTDIVMFKRSPRLKLEIPTGEIEIQSPPSIGTKPEMNWLSVILPSVGTVGASLIVTFVAGMSPMMLAFTAPMAIIGIVISITNYFKQKKNHSQQEILRLEKYNEHLNEAIKLIESKQEEQKKALISANPDTKECFNIIKNIGSSLWSRRPSDADFMSFRIGSGTLDFSMSIKIPRTTLSLTEDNLQRRPNEIYAQYKEVKALPINCSLLNWSTCGIVGAKQNVITLVNNILAQITTHHCYTEVKTVIVYDSDKVKDLLWTDGLPHTHDNDRKYSYVAHNKKEATELFNALESECKSRLRDSEDEHYEKTLKIPYYVFIIAEPQWLKSETISKYLYKNDGALGIGTIFLCNKKEDLPKECNIIIESNNNEGVIYNTHRASQKQSFKFDITNADDFKLFGKAIKNIYCDEMSGEASIPKQISLFEVMGIKKVAELNIEKRWKSSDITKNIIAPLGVKEKNELVYLDLHENAQGPHGLVAGATGYGKSEVIQSYLLALATLYHPYEVGFVIIDFKGGGMSEQFRDLPHLIGAITDMDGREIERSKQSIKAELDKRKRLFAENSVNKIDDYIELYKQHKVTEPIPHLIIVVDEFAELRADQPEFLDDLTSTARIGRSLGVHLILATQNPAGQVNDQIQSNAKFGICLSVKDKAASQEVIKSPLAERITDKGRAYLKVFEGNTLELFQSGYSGTKIIATDGSSITELKAIVNYIKEFCEEQGIQRLSPICLPPLDKVITYDNELVLNNIKQTKIPIGVFDDPSHQEQGLSYIDVEQNVIAIGSSQTGKTNLLQEIVRTLSLKYTPNEVNIYIMDFASMTLKNFEKLHHIGGVVIADEDEKLRNLFKLIESEIEYRKKKAIEVGVSSYSAYLEGGYTDIPRIVLLLDNYAAYKETYDEEFDTAFNHICREGGTYGISVIITSTGTTGFKHKYLSYFPERIAFTCNDNNEYITLYDRCKIEPANIAGRTLYKTDSGLQEMQTFLAFEGDKEIDRSRTLKEYIDVINSKYEDCYAKPIPHIPDCLSAQYVEDNYECSQKKYEYIMGLDYATVDIVACNFNRMPELAIVGNNAHKRIYAVSLILKMMKQQIIDYPVKAYIIDAIERPLKKYSDMPFIEKYSIDYSEIGNVLDDVMDETEKRYNILVNQSIDALENFPLITIIINNRDAIDYISSTKDILENYKKIQKQIKGLKIAFIFSDVDNTNVGFNAPEILKRLREAKKAFFTDDLKESVFFEIAPKIVRNSKSLQENDVFNIDGSDVKRIRLIEEVK